jgi:predicted RNA-binding protein with PIN domain
MPYLIDGNNLIGAIKELDINDPAGREKMTEMLMKYHRVKNNTIKVVYDGPPPPGLLAETHYGSITIRYAGPDYDADTVIKREVDRSKSPESIIVVSNDKQVYSYCKWAGAKALRVNQFYDDLVKVLEKAGMDPRKFKELSKNEVDDWMEYFGIDEDE